MTFYPLLNCHQTALNGESLDEIIDRRIDLLLTAIMRTEDPSATARSTVDRLVTALEIRTELLVNSRMAAALRETADGARRNAMEGLSHWAGPGA
jgi:hypothetical protein